MAKDVEKQIEIIKLVSGEEVIGEVIEMLDVLTGTPELMIFLPLALRMVPSEDQGIGLAMIPWMPYVKEGEGIPINKNSIISRFLPSDDLKNEYNRRFGIGIVTPGKKIIQ